MYNIPVRSHYLVVFVQTPILIQEVSIEQGGPTISKRISSDKGHRHVRYTSESSVGCRIKVLGMHSGPVHRASGSSERASTWFQRGMQRHSRLHSRWYERLSSSY